MVRVLRASPPPDDQSSVARLAEYLADSKAALVVGETLNYLTGEGALSEAEANVVQRIVDIRTGRVAEPTGLTTQEAYWYIGEKVVQGDGATFDEALQGMLMRHEITVDTADEVIRSRNAN